MENPRGLARLSAEWDQSAEADSRSNPQRSLSNQRKPGRTRLAPYALCLFAPCGALKVTIIGGTPC